MKKVLESKLDYILKLEDQIDLSSTDWNRISELARDDIPEVRLRISELLALFPSKESEKILLTLLEDSDVLVRASACDSLSFSNSKEVLDALLIKAMDKRYLVRGYAIISLGDIQYNIGSNTNFLIDRLIHLEKKEKSEWVKIAIFRSLFLLGRDEYENRLLEKLNDRQYRNRCFLLNAIDELISYHAIKDRARVLQQLKQRLVVERAFSVREHLRTLIKKIEKQISTP